MKKTFKTPERAAIFPLTERLEGLLGHKSHLCQLQVLTCHPTLPTNTMQRVFSPYNPQHSHMPQTNHNLNHNMASCDKANVCQHVRTHIQAHTHTGCKLLPCVHVDLSMRNLYVTLDNIQHPIMI